MPTTIAAFADAANRITLFIEMLYGRDQGTDRSIAIHVFENLRRGNPNLYTVAFVLETWRRMNVDFCEGMRERVRR